MNLRDEASVISTTFKEIVLRTGKISRKCVSMKSWGAEVTSDGYLLPLFSTVTMIDFY